MEQHERDIYMMTGAVAEFVSWLHDKQKLDVGSAKEAQRLGEQFFERLEELGTVDPAWRDHAHINLTDWAGK